MTRAKNSERGTILLIVLFLAAAIAGLAALSSGRVVAETKRQGVLEDETRAFNQAYSQLHIAMNIVNNSMYDVENHNLALQAALSPTGIAAANAMTSDQLLLALQQRGGAYANSSNGISQDANLSLDWFQNPAGVQHGMVPGTTARVYRANDYIKRLQKLKGESIGDVDPLNLSQRYFVVEAAGRSGSTIRMVAALVRENEPFSSFVFFQNRHTLGVSGKPRGLIHANDKIAFYFPNGYYVDPVSAVNGFEHTAGANTGNTNVLDGNPSATEISLGGIDFDDLRTKANLFLGDDGLDAEIRLYDNGNVRVRQMTPPRWEMEERSNTYDVLVGFDQVTVTEQQQVQIGTTTEQRTRSVYSHTESQSYDVDIPVYETQTVTQSRDDPVFEMQDIERSREEPVFEIQDVDVDYQVAVWDTRTVTRTRRVRVFVPYDSGEGGTAVGGNGEGVAGEYVWIDEDYETTEDYISSYITETRTEQQQVQVGTTTVTWTEQQQVQVGTVTVTWDEDIQVQIGTTTETRFQDVDIYVDETYDVELPVYETQDVDVIYDVPQYETRTDTWLESVFRWPQEVDRTYIDLDDGAGTIFIDGRITRLYGDLKGRLTIVGNEKVRVTGNIRYVDGAGETAMLNGSDYTESYTRNTDYTGDSVLGVLARKDLVLTRSMPNQAEINATLMSVEGRVGIDGFAIDSDGEPTKSWHYGMTAEEIQVEDNYDRVRAYRTRRFRRDSLRRIGGIISNDRILETFIKPRNDGTAYVDSGFKRGSMKFDINLLFNPPPNFVEVPRPVLINYAPIFLVRNDA